MMSDGTESRGETARWMATPSLPTSPRQASRGAGCLTPKRGETQPPLARRIAAGADIDRAIRKTDGQQRLLAA
jgi:hypothetical protein